MLRREPPNVIGNVKIQGITTAALNLHITGTITEGLQLQNECARELRLQGTHEHQNCEVAPTQERQALRLDVLKINQDEIGFQKNYAWKKLFVSEADYPNAVTSVNSYASFPIGWSKCHTNSARAIKLQAPRLRSVIPRTRVPLEP